VTLARPFGEEIWVVDGPTVKMYGLLPFATRMTVVRLPSGGLWIQSPVRPDAGICCAVEALGDVRYLVAPNKIHSLGIGPWQTHYASAEVWASPQFHHRHPAIRLDGRLDNSTVPPWTDEILHHAVGGHRFLDEVVFLHPLSQTLIVTDLIQKHDRTRQSWFWAGIKAMVGVLGRRGGVPRDLMFSFQDRDAARNSLETILGWDFDTLIVAHGFCLRGGAKREVRRCFSWLLD